MEKENAPDSFCPMGIVVFPALIGGLVWLCALIAQVGY